MAYSFFLVSDNRKVQFPIAPSELTINVKGRNETIDLMNEGEVNLLKSPGLTEISFTALIPQVGRYPFAVNDEPIDTFVHFLNDMLEEKKPFQFVVVRAAGTKLLFDTNLKVSCEGYDMKESADNGFDVELSISLKQYRDYGIKTVKLVTINTTVTDTTTTDKKTTTTTTAASTSKKRSGSSSSNKTYTVKKGDTLWGISKKFYGTGTKWKTIYNKNKSTIEAAAKKHGKSSSSNGHWIYPGTKLIIPGVSSGSSSSASSSSSSKTSTAGTNTKSNLTNVRTTTSTAVSSVDPSSGYTKPTTTITSYVPVPIANSLGEIGVGMQATEVTLTPVLTATQVSQIGSVIDSANGNKAVNSAIIAPSNYNQSVISASNVDVTPYPDGFSYTGSSMTVAEAAAQVQADLTGETTTSPKAGVVDPHFNGGTTSGNGAGRYSYDTSPTPASSVDAGSNTGIPYKQGYTVGAAGGGSGKPSTSQVK